VSAGPYGALLDAVRGVRWPSARRVSAATLGAHRSKLKGNSSEFSEFRPYRQGDDPRRLDWRLLARSDRAYVRLTTDRATLRTGIVVDGSASMAFPANTLDKWRLAREMAIGLAAVAHAEADPVGLAIAHESPAVLLPRARRSVLHEMMRGLDATMPSGSAALAPFVASLRSTRVVIISDLLGDLDDVMSAARLRIASGGEVIFAHVVAVEELDPPGEALVAIDPEEATTRRVLDQNLRVRYRERYMGWLDAVAASARAAGIRYLMIRTDEQAAHAVRRIAGDTVRRS
jgi:uncharacterized protein (DUF58 family)